MSVERLQITPEEERALRSLASRDPPRNIHEAENRRAYLRETVRIEQGKLTGAKHREWAGKELWLVQQKAHVADLQAQLAKVNEWIAGRNRAINKIFAEGAKRRRARIAKGLADGDLRDLLYGMLEVVDRMSRVCEPEADEKALIKYVRDVVKAEED